MFAPSIGAINGAFGLDRDADFLGGDLKPLGLPDNADSVFSAFCASSMASS